MPDPSLGSVVEQQVAADTTPFRPEARATIAAAVDALRPELTDISLYISDNPELAYKEVKAVERLTAFLTSKGCKVTSYADQGLPTAFRVSYTRGSTPGRVFGLNSEYDALPHMGHACGHNLIAITGVGAFLALRDAMDKHAIDGTVVLLGTPAEEGEGGKVKLLDAGAYKDMDACMMLHPVRSLDGESPGGGIVKSLAIQHINVKYEGKPAHAGLAPWEGVNALDAAVMAYTSISVLRQQLKPESRVQGVITNGGGTAPNIIPPETEMNYYIRATTSAELAVLRAKILKCFEGAATATGCKLKTKLYPENSELINAEPLAVEYKNVMGEMHGVPVMLAIDQSIGASTDFGNVSHVLPGCHPMYGIPAPVQNHTPEFMAAARTDRGHDETFKATEVMACVGMRFLADAEFAAAVKGSWDKQMAVVHKEAAKLGVATEVV